MGAINKLMLHGCALLKHDRYIVFVHHILVMLIAPVVRIVVPMISCIKMAKYMLGCISFSFKG